VAIPASRLSWVTSSPPGGVDEGRTQDTVELDTADESVRHWRLGQSPGASRDDAPDGPVSPDGHQRLSQGFAEWDGRLALGDADGVRPLTESVRLSDPVQGPNWPLRPTLVGSTEWHPSGRAVYAAAATTRLGDPLGDFDWTPKIVRFDLDGENYTSLVDFPDDTKYSYAGQTDPEVDAGNEHLAFVTQVDPTGQPTGQPLELYGYTLKPWALYVAGTDGSQPTPLVTGDHWLSIQDTAIAPDGSAVIFSGVTDTFAAGLFSVSTATGIVTQLTNAYDDPDYLDATPDWSPDGAHIAYVDRDELAVGVLVGHRAPAGPARLAHRVISVVVQRDRAARRRRDRAQATVGVLERRDVAVAILPAFEPARGGVGGGLAEAQSLHLAAAGRGRERTPVGAVGVHDHTRDPAEEITDQPYAYANDDPLTR
jgi:hypothetical protein